MSEQTTSFAQIFNSGFWEGMQQFTDGTLQTDDKTTFRIHRVVLSPRSGYFRALFSFHVNEKTFVIPNINSKMLESLLIFMYTGTITIDEKNLCDCLIASDYLLMDDMLKKCESFVTQNVTSTNCLGFLTIALQINRLAVIEKCYRCALVFFEEILETSNCGLVDLPVDVLRKLLESNSLNVSSERSVWRAIVSWTEVNSSRRLPSVPLLLTCLRLEEEVTEDLSSEILSHSIVSDNPHIFDLMLGNQFNFHMLKRRILSQCECLDPRYQNLPCSYGTRVPNRLHLISRFAPTRNSSELFLSYDNELDIWRQIGETHFWIQNMLRIGQRIYMLAWQSVLSIFDIVEEAWLERDFPTGPTSSDCFGGTAITLGEHLYYISRSRTRMSFSNIVIFRYEFDRNRWKRITMTRDISIRGVVTLKDQIFIVGAYDLGVVMMCRAYDPEKDFWISLSAPNIFRQGFSTVAFHGKLFAIAGKTNDGEDLKNVEVYDPLKNTWMSIPDLPFVYFVPGAVIVDDKIIVYEKSEEEDREYQAADPPVYWDEGTELWRIIDESSPWYHIERYSFLALDDCRIVKDLTAKNRRRGNEWKRSRLV